MTATAVPFDGTPPEVKDGDAVEIRDVEGSWHRTVARSVPRYDFDNMLGRRCWLSVAVVMPGENFFVNWPAEAVRKVDR